MSGIFEAKWELAKGGRSVNIEKPVLGKIRMEPGRFVPEVMEAVSEYPTVIADVKQALAALSQPKTFPADLALARAALDDALSRVGEALKKPDEQGFPCPECGAFVPSGDTFSEYECPSCGTVVYDESSDDAVDDTAASMENELLDEALTLLKRAFVWIPRGNTDYQRIDEFLGRALAGRNLKS